MGRSEVGGYIRIGTGVSDRGLIARKVERQFHLLFNKRCSDCDCGDDCNLILQQRFEKRGFMPFSRRDIMRLMLLPAIQSHKTRPGLALGAASERHQARHRQVNPLFQSNFGC